MRNLFPGRIEAAVLLVGVLVLAITTIFQMHATAVLEAKIGVKDAELARITATPKSTYQKSFLFVVPVSGRPAQSILNEHLVNGWRVVHATPLGGSDAGGNFMTLLILERNHPPSDSEPWFDERHAPVPDQSAPPAHPNPSAQTETPGPLAAGRLLLPPRFT